MGGGDDLIADREAEAGALADGFGGKKGVKQLGLGFGIHAHAVIGDRNGEEVCGGGGGDGDLAGGGGVGG